jgi:hypothetical protein
LLELEHEHLSLSEDYEKSSSYEMSYVALWTILEHIMKPIASIGMRKKLESSLHEWIEHIKTPVPGKQPKEIKDFKIEYTSTSIPPVSLIEEAIGNVPKLKLLMHSTSKYRRKRNDIAHRAEKLSETIYGDYKSAVLSAIAEIKLILNEHDECA